MSRLARRLWKWTAAVLAGLLILLAIGVGLFRLAVPMVPELRADAEIIAERAIGWPVHIGEIDLRWAWLGPELVLTDVQLLAPDTRQPLVTAARLDIIFGPLDLFQDGTPRPSHLRLHQPTLALERAADGELYLSGYALPDTSDSRLDWRRFLDLALRHGRLTILEGELHYRDSQQGIDDWEILLTKVSLASDGRNHELDGTFQPPGALGEQVVFHVQAQGEPALPEAWTWTLQLGVTEMKLDWWYQQIQWAGPRHLDGTLDLAMQAAGDGLEGMVGSGSLAIEGLGFADAVGVALPEDAQAPFDRIALDWEFDYDGRLAIDVRNLEILHPQANLAGGSFALRTRGTDHPVEFAAARLPLEVLRLLAGLLPPPRDDAGDASSLLANVREAIRRRAPQGELHELILGLDLDAEPPRFRVETRFENVGIAYSGGMPGFSGLSGTLRGNEEFGRLVLDSHDARIDLGELFRGPLPARRLAGDFTWTALPGGWRISGAEILVENPEAVAEARLVLDLPDDGSPLINLDATARNVDFRARSTWLPVGIMSDALIQWLDNGVISGHAPQATLVLRGPLENFPFRDDSGVFDIRFRAEDTVVEYAPGWPLVENLSAAVHFQGPGLSISIDHATVMDALTVDAGSARFPDFRDKQVTIRATTTGDTAAGWRFLAASPLKDSLDGLLGAIQPTGPMQAKVALDIPLGDVDGTQARIDAVLRDVRVKPVALPWAVESLDGALTVTDRTITADKLEGRFTGAPFVAAIHAGTPSDSAGFAPTRVSMQGRTPVQSFEAFLPASWMARLEGALDWTGELRVPGDEGGVTMEFASALRDVQSHLPAPLEQLPPARAEIVLPDASHVDVRLQAEDLGAGRLRFVEGPSGWVFDRGLLSLGQNGVPELQRESGLFIDGHVAELEADAWLSLDDGAKDGGAALLRRLDLVVDRFRFGDTTLVSQRVRADRAGAGWEVLLEGPATGSIHVPSLRDTSRPWQVRLEQLHLPAGDEPAGDDTVPDPRTLPGLVLDIGDLQFGSVNLGHVTGALERNSTGYTTENLEAHAPSFDMRLNGRWEFIQDSHYTSISTVLDSSDLEASLARLGYQAGLAADGAHVEADLAWHGAPLAFDLGLLEGTVSFRFEDGSLSEVNPGAGRLLGLFSITALPRRLTLDFSDFFSEGLSFDTLSGDFLVTGGNAYTTNVTLEGPSISALLVGRTGLATRDYDQLVIVDPGVSASLPVAGYLAAGPTVGAALLLFSQLLKAPLADITQVKYRITGGWDDPVIERVQQESDDRQ